MHGDAQARVPSYDSAGGKVSAWIEKNVGGSIERFERQSRWRGGWWVDVRRNGELLKLYVREERKEDFPPWPLEHEAGVLQILERHGVPVPHVHGICDDPHAIVMEALPGSTSFSAVKSEAERLSVINDYAEAVARMHSIDPQELVQLGVKMPETPEEISLGCFKLCEDMYVKGKTRPDPRIEFLRKWIYRNIPRQRGKVSILSVDAGQFLLKDGRVTGLFDMEYACLGDPMIDLASVAGRAAGEGAGDTRPFFRRYVELTGDELDPKVILFHRVWWGLCTPLIITRRLWAPPADATYFDYLLWYISPLMGVFLAIAQLKGFELVRDLKVKRPQPSRWAQIFDVMAARIPPQTADEPYEITERRKFMEFIKRADGHRDVENEYIEQVGQLLGRRCLDWMEADRELEEFVMTAGPERDDELVHLFYRWTLAQTATLIDGISPVAYLHRPYPNFSQLLAKD